MSSSTGDRSAGPSTWLTTQAAAQAAAIGWLGSLGHSGASVQPPTDRSRTSGMVTSTSATAHVSFGVPVTHKQALEDLVADARSPEMGLIHFTSGTYSEAALAYADRFGLALFTYDSAGNVSHANAAAMSAIIATPAPTPTDGHPRSDTPPEGPPTGAGPSRSNASRRTELRTWAEEAWRARQVASPASGPQTYLPLGGSLLIGLLTLPIVRAWQTGAEPTLRGEAVAVPVVVFLAVFVWGVWRVWSHREQLRRHRHNVRRACAPPPWARALVDAVMRMSGRGVPDDREAFVLLRNEVTELSGVDPFTASVLVWEATIGAARPTDRHDWLEGPPNDGRAARPW